MPIRESRHDPDENDLHQLKAKIPVIFDAVQTSKANWTKNCVNLHKFHKQISVHEVRNRKGHWQAIGEEEFLDGVKDVLSRVLTVKKGVASADNVVAFLGAYIKYMNEAALEEGEDEDDEDDDDFEGKTTASRFTKQILRWLVKGFGAKDKIVRSRILNAVSEMLPHLGQITEEQFEDLEESFVNRIQDKDSIVRRFAATCLARLLLYDPDIELNNNESIEILTEVMAHDPASEVRKAIVENIPVFENTLVAILKRTRDTDSAIRKFVYDFLRRHIKPLKQKGDEDGTGVGPTHPRALSISQRDLIVENGLKDRVPLVKMAAATLLWHWYLAMRSKSETEESDVKQEDHEAQSNSMVDTGIAFLRLFDLGTRPDSAEEALACIFKTQPSFTNGILLSDSYWTTLNQEKAFFARVLVEHYVKLKESTETSATSKNQDDRNKASLNASQCQDRLEAILPEVTVVASLIEDNYIQLGQLSGEREDDIEETNIILAQLVGMALSLDYSDEVGRRKMHSLMREMLQDLQLPDTLISPSIDLLRLLSNDERDFIRLVVENIQELRECIDESENAELPVEEAPGHILGTPSPQPVREEVPAEVKDAIDGKCLFMCVSMLRNVMSLVEQNSTLDYVIAKLILPRAAENRGQGPHVTLALKAMSLCSLISETLALKTLDYAQKAVRKAAPEAKIILCQAMFDIYMVYQYDFYKKKPDNLESVADFLVDQLVLEKDPEIKAILCEGTAKLVLSGMVSGNKAITTLTKTFIDPSNSKNEKLKQCLRGFFHIYTTSSALYQENLCDIFVHIFLDFCEDIKELDEEEAEANPLTSMHVANLFVVWTDSSQLTTISGQNNQITNLCTHLRLAENIIKLLINKDLKVEIEKEDKKVLCRLLDKLYIPDEVDDYKIRSLDMLLEKLCALRPLKDSVCKNAVNKFSASIKKRFHTQLDGISEEDLRKLEEHQELFDFVDSIIPLDEEDEDDQYEAPRRGRKRPSDSFATSPTASRSSTPASANNRRSKRPRLSGSNDPDDDEDDSIMCSARSTPMPTVRRPRPKRVSATAASQKNAEVIVISSDSDEGDLPSKRTSNARLPFRRSVKQEAPPNDDDLNRLLASASIEQSETSFDSIMDSEGSNSEEDEEEVTDLLADE